MYTFQNVRNSWKSFKFHKSINVDRMNPIGSSILCHNILLKVFQDPFFKLKLGGTPNCIAFGLDS